MALLGIPVVNLVGEHLVGHTGPAGAVRPTARRCTARRGTGSEMFDWLSSSVVAESFHLDVLRTHDLVDAIGRQEVVLRSATAVG